MDRAAEEDSELGAEIRFACTPQKKGEDIMITASEREDFAAPTMARIKWSALLAGATLSVGVWILLHVLGLAAGLTSIDPHSPGSLRAAGIGTGIWSVVASLLALFAGGALASYMAGPVDRVSGAMHGAVLWALTLVAGVFMIASVAGMAMSGAVRAGSAAAGMASSLGERGGGGDPLQGMGLSAQDLLAPVNQQLQGQGKPAISPDQLREAVKEGLRTGVQQGRLDREILITALVRNTALTRADVTDLVGQIEQRSGRLGEQLEAAQTGALQAAENTGKGLWGVFGALLLGLIAAVGGALTSVAARRARTIETARELGRQAPLGPPAHVPA